MLAFGSYNPAVITLFIDRLRFQSYFVQDCDSWEADLQSFLAVDSEGRDKVLLADLATAKKAKSVPGTEKVKCLVFGTATKILALDGVTIVDVDELEKDTWQIKKIDINELNDQIADTSPGWSLSSKTVEAPPPPVAKPPKESVHEDLLGDTPHYEERAEGLTAVIGDVLDVLPDDLHDYFRERCLQYLTAQVTKRSLGGAKRKVATAGATKAQLDDVTQYIESKKGVALRDAYILYAKAAQTIEQAAKKTGADEGDLRYVIAHAPPTSEITFLCDDVVAKLLEKN